jgi:hypothetical protein
MSTNRKVPRIAFLLLCFIAGLTVGVWLGANRMIPLSLRKENWSIGIYSGRTPFDLKSDPNGGNPVLEAKDITDVAAEFLADPFMLRVESTWYMFFEILERERHKGVIGVATSKSGLEWKYEGVVLDEVYHLSYPCVFMHDGQAYMVPESAGANAVLLYRAVNFPKKWELVDTLVHDERMVDNTIFQWGGKWWMFTTQIGVPSSALNLRLFLADSLFGPWHEHPRSPVISGNADLARCGGRVLVADGKLYRLAQDDYPTYGNQVNAAEVTVLTPDEYHERPYSQNPVLKGSGEPWTRNGMHHLDAHRVSDTLWIACVDGLSYPIRISFRDPSSGSSEGK